MSPRNRSLKPLAITLLAALALATPMQTRAVVAPVPGYSVSPNPAPADKAFTLYLNGASSGCNTTFSRESVTVVGKVIDLSYVATSYIIDPPVPVPADPAQPSAGIVCPVYDQPATTPNIMIPPYGYGAPTYSMPALKAGTYEVWATQMYECLYTQPSCKIAVQRVSAGTLTVTDITERKGWFLKEHTVVMNKPFSMQLLNQAYGNCQTTFSHQTVNVQSGNIYTSFLVETNPAQVCIVDLHPWGPTFEMQAMTAGIYPLYVSQLAQCQVSPPYCGLAILPVLSDTLVVSRTTSILMSELRRSPQVDLNGSKAAFLLPKDGGRGVWKAELLTLSGRRLASVPVTGEGGQRAEIELGLKPERGVYLLRLSAPGGETHLLPFVRKN